MSFPHHGINLCTWRPFSPGSEQLPSPEEPLTATSPDVGDISSPSPPPSTNENLDSNFAMYYQNWILAPLSEKEHARQVLEMFLEINPEYRNKTIGDITQEDATSIEYYALLMRTAIATLKQKLNEATDLPQIGWAELDKFGTMHPAYQADITKAKTNIVAEVNRWTEFLQSRRKLIDG